MAITDEDLDKVLKATADLHDILDDAGLRFKVLHSFEFPTEIIEEGYVRVRIESLNNEVFARIVWPTRELDEEESLRLEFQALSLWNQRPVQ